MCCLEILAYNIFSQSIYTKNVAIPCRFGTSGSDVTETKTSEHQAASANVFVADTPDPSCWMARPKWTCASAIQQHLCCFSLTSKPALQIALFTAIAGHCLYNIFQRAKEYHMRYHITDKTVAFGHTDNGISWIRWDLLNVQVKEGRAPA